MTDNPAKRILVGVPTYNNEKTIGGIIRGILDMGLPVLTVNDGSTDGTSSIIAQFPIDRIEFPKNRGKGRAIRSALKWAHKKNFDWLITIDADGQHNPADISRFIEKIKESTGKIIIGKRDFGENVPKKSRFGRGWSNMWIRIASGGNTPDSQSGFRAYPTSELTRLKFFGSRYEFEIEVLVRAVWAGLELDSVDVSVRYFQGNERVSHFRPLLDNFRISVMYTILVTRQLLPIPHRKLLKKKGRKHR